jgi:sulfotransferase family protein
VIVHIGYHKTASSWLQRHVFGNPKTGLQTVGKFGPDHPVRQLVRVRPLEFDAAAVRALFEPLLQPVRDAGLVPVVSWERLSGHAVSGGYDSKELANRVREVFPEATILVVIREQRSMIVSTYKQYVMGGGPNSVDAFLAPHYSQNMRLPWFDLRHFEYDHLLRHYRSLFGDDSVLALPFEQFLREPHDFVAAIGQCAERPIDDALIAAMPFGDVHRPSLSALELELRRRRNRFVRSELNPAPLESQLLKRLTKLKQAAVKPLVRDRLRARADSDLKERVVATVGDRYRESNRATAELTGLDLAGYGWTI